jgi:hypothetical protein
MSSYLGHEDACPICFHELDSVTCVDSDARPEPGDLTVCLYCAELLVLDKSLRHVCLDEHGGIESLEPELRRLLLLVQKAVREGRPGFQPSRRRATH